MQINNGSEGNNTVAAPDPLPPTGIRCQRVHVWKMTIKMHLHYLLHQLDQISDKDCYCLGKFNPNHSCPRPLMLKFVWNIDAAHILSKRKLLQPPICKARFKHWWKENRTALINSGILCNRIKLHKSQLYWSTINHTVQSIMVNFALLYIHPMIAP